MIGIAAAALLFCHCGARAAALPFLPYGAYSDPPYGCLFEPGCGGRTDWKDLPEVEVTQGMNFFTPYLSERGGHNATSWAAIEAYLARAEQLGVTVNYALNHLCGGADNGGCGADRLALIETEVRRVARYKCIYAWYISDEPDGNHVPPAEFAAAAAAVRALDSRPISVVLDGATNQTRALPYAMAVDILMADPYPVGHIALHEDHLPGGQVGDVAAATDAVVQLIATATAKGGRARRVIMVPQAFGALGRSWGRNPTRFEGRVMVYLMTMHGSQGILLYARRGPYTMPTNQVLWGEYRALSLELQEISPQLQGGVRSNVSVAVTLLHGDAAALAADLVGPDAVEAVQFTLAGGSTVVLVTNALALSCLFTLSGVTLLEPGHHVEVLFENRAINASSSGFSAGASPSSTASTATITDTISAMGTRAYRVLSTGAAAPPAGPAPSPPLLLNGGFESSSSPGVPDGVYAIPTGDLGSSFFVDARLHAGSVQHPGAVGHSLRLHTGRQGEGVRVTLVTQGLLSGSAFTLALSATTADHAAALEVSFASRGDSPSCCEEANSSTITLNGDESGALAFQKFSVTMQLPGNCAAATVGCEPTLELTTGSATVWVDNVVLTPTAAMAPPLKLKTTDDDAASAARRGTSSTAAWNGPLAGTYKAGDPCAVANPAPSCGGSGLLRVAAVQLSDFADGVNRSASEETTARTAKAVAYIAQAAQLGVDVALFPEMSLVQYNGAALVQGTQADMDAAEAAVATACRDHKIWAIIGLPQYYTPSPTSTKKLPSCCSPAKCWYNTGLVINDRGEKTYRQAKMHSAGPDGQVGIWLDTFKVKKNVTASMQICMDAYFPHMTLVRQPSSSLPFSVFRCLSLRFHCFFPCPMDDCCLQLPVLAGSRLIFDLSSERGYDDDRYCSDVGALYQGRAQEANAHLVQANTGAAIHLTPGMVHEGTFAGSHGNSQVIDPNGHVLAKAKHVGEQIVLADIPVVDESRGGGGGGPGAWGGGANDANPVFSAWLQAGLKLLGNRMPIEGATDLKTDDTAATAGNICASNATLGKAVIAAMNLTKPGLEQAATAAAAGDAGKACEAIAKYYRTGTSAAWLRFGPVAAGHGRVGGAVDEMVQHDIFTGFPSPAGPVKIPRNGSGGGLSWTWWGPDHDDEFMNVLNRHQYFASLLGAWNQTGNGVYASYFDRLVRDWVLHLPCSGANATDTTAGKCVPLGDAQHGRVCQWDEATMGGACATGAMESPWRSLEMGIRMAGPWPQAFFGFQQASEFTTDGRVLLLLGVSEHFQGLLVDGGHAGRGTVNWEMTQWRGLLSAAAAFPEVSGAAEVAAASMHYLTDFLESGVYPDGVETEMASGYDMGTAGDYYASLKLNTDAGLPAPPATFYNRVEAMYNYGAYVADQNGCLPMNGDSDLCGCGFVREVAQFFNRSDWHYVRTGGQFGTKPSTRPGHETPSVMFPWAGQSVLRSDWTNGSHLWFDVGPFGSNPFHAHRDKLSVLLHAHGSILLEDSGRFAYAGTSFSHARRPYCHETQAHNTLRIDGLQQAQAPKLVNAPRPNHSWTFEPDRDIVQGSMASYDQLEGSAEHSRTVYHQRGRWFLIVDVVTSDRGSRAVQATWHMHPNASVALGDSDTAIIGGVDQNNQSRLTGAQLALIPASVSSAVPLLASWNSSKIVTGQLAGKNGAVEDQGWFSEHYSDATASPTLVYDSKLGSGQKQAVFAWLLLISPTPFGSTISAGAVITAATANEVHVTVTVEGSKSQIIVPFETSIDQPALKVDDDTRQSPPGPSARVPGPPVRVVV